VSEDALRFPIGRFDATRPVAEADRPALIAAIAAAPAGLRAAVRDLTPDQLDTPYREGGWTVRQVVHHVPDSHLNAYVRFKWTLTEDEPVIRTYDEKGWAELVDTRETPVEVSLDLLDYLHDRWVRLLRGMDDAQWRRTLRHPDWGELRLPGLLALYAWHGRHHTAHVTALRERMGW
jgi:uncharacterized damage-inducible protein DinB